MRTEVNSNWFDISLWGKASLRCKLLYLLLPFQQFNFSKMKDINMQMKEIRTTGLIPSKNERDKKYWIHSLPLIHNSFT